MNCLTSSNKNHTLTYRKEVCDGQHRNSLPEREPEGAPLHVRVQGMPLSSAKIIKEAFKQDQADRRNPELLNLPAKERWAYIKPRDKKRVALMRKIFAEKPKLKALDYFRAGIIFQHGGTPEATRTAVRMARYGMKTGHKKSRWLFAAATDRLLIQQGKKQKFGTQFQRNEKGLWHLLPLNPRTTDADRQRYDVRSLRKLEKVVEKLNRAGGARVLPSKKIGISRS